MSKESLVLLIGLVVFLTPFLGVPRTYKEWILGISGGLLMILGYQLRRKLFLLSLLKEGERKGDAFVEAEPDPKLSTSGEQHTTGTV